MVSVRYVVDDVEAAIGFYTERLGFDVAMRPGPGFAALVRGDLRLLVSAPGGPGGAAQPALDGRVPEPGGWTAFSSSSTISTGSSTSCAAPERRSERRS